MADRGGTPGGRRRTRSNRNIQVRSVGEGDEPKAKISRMEAAAQELSDLLSQPAEILVQIINYLDAESLRELALSCQFLFNFCLNTRGIHVVLPLEKIHLAGVSNGSINFIYSCHRGCQHDYRSFERYLGRLSKWPLAIHIDTAHATLDAWNETKAEVKDLFVNSGVKKIRHFTLRLPSTVQEVDYFSAEFVKVFDIDGIEFTSYQVQRSNEAIEACVGMPVSKQIMQSLGGVFDADLLLNCSIPVLVVGAKITLTGLDSIIQA